MLILASASPRRQQLLRNAKIPFLVEPTHLPELAKPGEEPKSYVERLAAQKARVIAGHHLDDFVLGADTTVVAGDQILNKPVNRPDAERMLEMLSGSTHQVMTGVCLIAPRARNEVLRKELVRSKMTSVTFERLREEEIQFYTSTGEGMDKAGGYAIQGIASRWISQIEGDYFNVVGLPVALVYGMLTECGFGAEQIGPLLPAG
ncbi:MAG: septum formation protein Maf [Acidobacteria bacterium]|nr:septum formation protein Maf [Acidobacteriota bacterium]